MELKKNRGSMNCKRETDFTSIENPVVKIAPLVFISLVENAFKHGISNKGDSFIRISLKEANNRVEFIAENSYFPKDSLDKSGSGIGLNQVKKRLEILYPNKYKWQYGINYNTYYSKLYLDI